MVKLEEARSRQLSRKTATANRDAARTSKKVIDKDDPRAQLWLKDPGKYDLAGVDTFGSRLTPVLPPNAMVYLKKYMKWRTSLPSWKADLNSLDASTIRHEALLGTLAFQVETIAKNTPEVKVLQPNYPHWLFYLSFILGGEHVRIDTLKPNCYARIRALLKKNMDGIGKDRLRSSVDFYHRMTQEGTKVDEWIKEIEDVKPDPLEEYADRFYNEARREFRTRKGTKLYNELLEGTRPLLLSGYATDFKKEYERVEFQSGRIIGAAQQVQPFGLQPRFLKVRVQCCKALRLGTSELYRAWNLYVKSNKLRKEYISRIQGALKEKEAVVKKLEARVTSKQVDNAREFFIQFKEERFKQLGKS